MQTYSLTLDKAAITCLLCGRTSHNPHDVRERYCGQCHVFHEAAALVLDILAKHTRMLVRQLWEVT